MELKQLQARKTKLEQKLDTAKVDKQNAADFFMGIKRQISNIENQIKILKFKKVKDPIISDHAVVLYLERVCGVDIEQIKEKILSPLVRSVMSQGDGNGKVKTADFTIVFKNRVIVTIK